MSCATPSGGVFGVIDKFVCPDVNGAEKANHGVDFISDREALNIISDDMSVPAQYSPMAPFESSQFDLPSWYILRWFLYAATLLCPWQMFRTHYRCSMRLSTDSRASVRALVPPFSVNSVKTCSFRPPFVEKSDAIASNDRSSDAPVAWDRPPNSCLK
jgi:hypothetical protein